MTPVTFRLGLHYGTLFLFLGIYGPYWGLWLTDHGVAAGGVGFLMASGILAKILINPMVASLADKRGLRRGPLIASAISSLIVFSVFMWADGIVPITILTLLFFACWTPSIPLTDSLTLLARDREPFDYGRVRLWGSLSFLAGAVGVGYWVSASGGAVAVILTAILMALALAVPSALMLPSFDIPRAQPLEKPFRDVWRVPGLVLLLAAAAAIQASHAPYYGFSAIHWRAAGIDETVIGLLWAEGVVLEIALFAISGPVVARVGAINMILIGGLAGIARWIITAETSALEVLIIIQVLHALSFGATHLGVIQVIADKTRPEISASAQSANALMTGTAMAAASLASGALYAIMEGQSFYLSAGLALFGVFLVRIRSARKENHENERQGK